MLRNQAILALLAALAALASLGCSQTIEESPESTLCSDTDCHHYAQCYVRDGEASCECPSICTADFAPVCGTDGITYNNTCQLEVASCNAQEDISVAFEGDCVHNNPCSVVRCGYSASCRVVDGKARCVCDSVCPAILKRVCGSDGKTYGNTCELERAACKNRTNISVVSEGQCAESDPCALLRCAGCKVIDGKARCGARCPSVCPMIYEPVCGSNGQTYGNTCQLNVASCESKTPITMAHSGACDSDCGSCTQEYLPICGSDNKTYSNSCHLKLQNCLDKTNVVKVTDGACPNKQTPVVCKLKVDLIES